MKKPFFLITCTLLLFFFLFNTLCTAKQMNILVYPFENTGDQEYSWISAGMTDTVISDLTHVQNISVVSNQDRKKVLEEMQFVFSGLAEEDKLIKLGKLTGANVIFSGSYLVSGNRIRVHARLVNVETSKVESSTKIDGTLNGIFDLQDKVVFTLMGETEKITIANIEPVLITEQDKKKIEEKSRPSISAYEWYAKGLKVLDTNPKEGLANFKKALNIDPNYTAALIQAGFTAGSTLNYFSEAIVYLEKAERIFNGRNEDKSFDYAALMNNMGIIYTNKGQLDRGLEYYLNSQSIMDSLGQKKTAGYAGLTMNIGVAYYQKGQLDRALEYYLNAQSIHDRLGLQKSAGYAGLTMNIGVAYYQKGQLDRALEYYLKAQSIYDRLGLQKSAGYAGIMYGIGNIYSNKGQLDHGLEYYLNAQSIYDRLGIQNIAGYATIMMNIGNVYNSKGQLDRALEYYLNSQSIRVRLGLQNTASYGSLLINIGNVYNGMGQLDRSLEYFLNAQSMYGKLRLQNTTSYAFLMYNMASLYEKQGHHDTAGRYFRTAYDSFVVSDYSGEWKDNALNNARRLGTCQ
jgi:tetratricopeptide (TPR) repeat protein/TolB-like protein